MGYPLIRYQLPPFPFSGVELCSPFNKNQISLYHNNPYFNSVTKNASETKKLFREDQQKFETKWPVTLNKIDHNSNKDINENCEIETPNNKRKISENNDDSKKLEDEFQEERYHPVQKKSLSLIKSTPSNLEMIKPSLPFISPPNFYKRRFSDETKPVLQGKLDNVDYNKESISTDRTRSLSTDKNLQQFRRRLIDSFSESLEIDEEKNCGVLDLSLKQPKVENTTTQQSDCSHANKKSSIDLNYLKLSSYDSPKAPGGLNIVSTKLVKLNKLFFIYKH